MSLDVFDSGLVDAVRGFDVAACFGVGRVMLLELLFFVENTYYYFLSPMHVSLRSGRCGRLREAVAARIA